MQPQQPKGRESRRYNYTVEICRNCGGHGTVTEWPDFPNLDEPVTAPCPLCGGSGRVHKEVTTITRLKPFTQK